MKIIFVANTTPLQLKGTSNDILTYNLFYGLSKISEDIMLIALNDLYENDKNYIKKINECYSSLSKNIFSFKSKIGKSRNKYFHILKLYYTHFFGSYKKEIKEIEHFIDNDTILITHSPSIESIFFCNRIKKKYKNMKWIQYWSDPVTLGGILPENINFKRYPYYYIERKCLGYADKIVYGTKTLLDFQKDIFPEFDSKMFYTDIPYSIINNNNKNSKDNINKDLLYAGNFFSYTRNIQPLYNAIIQLKGENKLIIYGDGDQFIEDDNIIYNARVSAEEINKIEDQYNNIICLLNATCIQIPGKIFYDINKNKKILIITDGKHKKEIIEYLDTFKRYIIVENNVESIMDGIKSMNNYDDKEIVDKKILERYSPISIAKKIVE